MKRWRIEGEKREGKREQEERRNKKKE